MKIPLLLALKAAVPLFAEKVYMFELAQEASLQASMLPAPLYKQIPVAILVEIMHLIF